MKHTKDRVIAIDYLRGICILMVILTHSAVFSVPFVYLAGAGGLWTSAAEMFLLLSGVTLGIIRGPAIRDKFMPTAKKIWRRAALIYGLNIILVILSLLMALFFTSHNLANDIPGDMPTNSGFSMLWSIFNLSYSVGWATFLMYYSIFLIFAPFALYALRTRYWALVPATSLYIYMLNVSYPTAFGHFSPFAMWQIYFVMGVVIARLRVPVISYFRGLKAVTLKSISYGLVFATGAVIAISALSTFNLSPDVTYLAQHGWLPVKAQSAYIHLINQKSSLDLLFMDSRMGIFRPIIALMVLASVYLIYQRYKSLLLARTGKFVNSMGRDTLWIFLAQAITIPILATIPLKHGAFFSDLVLTSTLIALMYSLTQRRVIRNRLQSYGNELRGSFNQAKNNYIYGSDSGS